MNILQQLAKLMVIIMVFAAIDGYSLTYAQSVEKIQTQGQEVEHIEMSFVDFMESIAAHMPITIDFLTAQKIVFSKTASSSVSTEYQAEDVVFFDSLTVDSISFREIHSDTKKGIIVTFKLRDNPLTQADIEGVFGKFKGLGVPRGDSLEETFSFIKPYDRFDIRVGYAQGGNRFLKSITFNSVNVVK